MQIVELPQLAWGDSRGTLDVADARVLKIAFPEGWQVELCHMAGHDRPRLASRLVRHAITNPIGSPPISEAARGRKEICIIFDDTSRPTRVAPIVPFILAELAKAGIEDRQVRFICALGCHGALTRRDFVKKLGGDVVSRFPVYNHNIVANCSAVGTTSFGTKLYINAEVMRCDYKIAVGSIVPHGLAGFGGGAKIILPGVASFETVDAIHRTRPGGAGMGSTGSGADMGGNGGDGGLGGNGGDSGVRGGASAPGRSPTLGGMGCLEGNLLRQNIEEAGAMVGLDFKIDALVNACGETVSVYAGAPAVAFQTALTEARWHYLTPRATNCDVVVTNTFAKANEGEGGTITGFPSIKETGGDLVLIANAPEGHVTHYLLGNWGNLGSDQSGLVVKLPPRVERLIIFNQYRDVTAAGYFSPTEKVLMLDRWEDVLRVLQEKRGDRAKVAVYSSAEIQYCDDSGGSDVSAREQSQEP